ncbi:MAG: 4Fe-4S binding protein [Oscillospiraceae bacterium]
MPHKITAECIGCTACAKSCPVYAIVGEAKVQHIINEKRCVDCGVCAELCPAGAILGPDGARVERAPRKNRKKPLIDEKLCSACQMCVQMCRFDCLEISRPKQRGDVAVFAILGNEKKCVGCALCERICPIGAITMKGGE